MQVIPEPLLCVGVPPPAFEQAAMLENTSARTSNPEAPRTDENFMCVVLSPRVGMTTTFRQAETVWKILEHAAANPDHGVVKTVGKTPFDATYAI